MGTPPWMEVALAEAETRAEAFLHALREDELPQAISAFAFRTFYLDVARCRRTVEFLSNDRAELEERIIQRTHAIRTGEGLPN